MPYSVVKIKGGWRVIKNDDPSFIFHKKPHKTKAQAVKQMHAIILSEHSKKQGKTEGGVVPFLSSLYNATPIRKDYNSETKKLLNKVGNEPIEKIVVYRKPVQTFVNTALNATTLGKWGRAIKKYGIDKVMHLYMVAYLKNGTNVLIEKNEIINIKIASINDTQPEKAQAMKVINNVPVGLTLNVMLQKTKDSMGTDRYWQYNAWTNNCQSFIKYILSSNGLLDPKLLDFIDQNIEAIANQSVSAPVKAAVNFTTTLASKLRTLTGRGIELF